MAQSTYMNEHPIIGEYTPELHTPNHILDTSHFITTTNTSIVDTIGSSAAEGLLGAFVSLGERLDPGIAPGAEAAKYGINRAIEADVAARSVHTSYVHSSAVVADPEYYTYRPTSTPVYDDYTY